MAVSELAPDAMDKLNTDEIVNAYGDATDIPPQIIRSDDDVQKIREQRQQQQAIQQQMQMQMAGAQIQKDESSAAKDIADAEQRE